MVAEQLPERREQVLIVDDSREIREFLAEYVLKPKGFGVLTASDGLEGLKCAFSERPDLMIVDVEMPNMSGLELLHRIRLRRLDIPAILITAHGSEQVAVKALRLGVRDYVIKPFVLEEMEDAIARALREPRLRAERGKLAQEVKLNNAQLRQRAQEINAVYSIGKAVSSSLDLETILQRVVEAAVYLAGADHGSLMLLDKARGQVVVRASKRAGAKAQAVSHPVDGEGINRVLRKKQTAILTERELPSRDDGPGSGAYIPLLVYGRPIGILHVAPGGSRQSFSKRETQVLSALASMAAIAIHNAQLHERISNERNALHQLAEQNREPVLLIDDNDRLLLANDAARQLLNLPEENLSGRPSTEVLEHDELLAFITGEDRNKASAQINLPTAGSYRARMTPIGDVGRSILLRKESVEK